VEVWSHQINFRVLPASGRWNGYRHA